MPAIFGEYDLRTRRFGVLGRAIAWAHRPARWFTLLCIAWTAGVGLVSAILGSRPLFIGLLIAGQCLAVATSQWRATALVSAWTVAVVISLGFVDNWGTRLHLEYTAAVVLAGVVATAAAIWVRRIAYDDVGFITTAYLGVLDRGPDAPGLEHHRRALRAGTPREQLILDIAESPEGVAAALYRPGVRNLMDVFFRLRADVDPRFRPVCFLHAMKTGGTALRRALVELALPWPTLADLMVDQFVSLPPPLIDHAMLIIGHLPYETVEMLPEGVALCTVIRDPLERTLSHHAHVNEMLAERGEPQVAIEEFVSVPGWRPMWENYQARQITHRIGLREAWKTFSPAQLAATRGIGGLDAEFPLQSLFDSTPMNLAGDDLLSAALDRLDSFEFVGTTEDLDAVAAAVARFWDRPAPPPVASVRVSRKRIVRDELSPDVCRLIEEGTAVDAALHARARDMALTRRAP